MKRFLVFSGLIAAGLIAIVLLTSENITRLDFTEPGGREMWQRPVDLVAALDIKPGQKVADIGTGQGYFIPYLQSAVGADGTVFAVDVEARTVEALKAIYSDPPVQIIKGDYDDPQLPDGAVDLVLIVNTFHHIEGRPAYFSKLKQDLAPGGRVAIVEPNLELTGLLSYFVHEEHASKAASVRDEMRQAGYRELPLDEFLPVQFLVVFVPE